jgi:DNA-binding NarL/FixJ family response regulator
MISIGLIVEDPHFLNCHVNYLTRFKNLELKFGYSCIEEYRNNLDKVKCLDVLLLDQKFIELREIESLKKDHINCKIILLSNKLIRTDVVSAIRQGVSGYMIKTGDSHELYNAIVTVFSGGCFLDPNSTKIIMDTIKKNNSNIDLQILSKREQEFVKEIFKGATYKQIADKLYVSPSTVSFHSQNIYTKLNVKSRAEFFSKYYRKEG